MRCAVRADVTTHSHTRNTFQPWRRSRRETRRSRLRLSETFFRQKPTWLFDGRLQRGQPCQKHPSTKTASRSLRKTKSGHPSNGRCRRQPLTPCFRKILIRLISVALFPLDRTAAMICDRFSLLTESDIQTNITGRPNQNEQEITAASTCERTQERVRPA